MPKYGDQERRTVISRLGVRAAWSGVSNPTDRNTATYQIPPGYVAVELETKIHDKSGDYSHSVGTIGPDADLIVEEHLKQIFEGAIDLSGSAGDDALKAKLEDRFDQQSEVYSRYRSEKGTIYAEVSATPHGTFMDRKRSWIDISVKALLRYIASRDPVELVDELEETYDMSESVSGPLRTMAIGLAAELPAVERHEEPGKTAAELQQEKELRELERRRKRGTDHK